MPDAIILERLELILEHTEVIIQRMFSVPDAEWFISGDSGEQMYDSIIARLQPIGENIKKIEKIEPGFVKKNLQLNPDDIIRFRDLIAHHYELLDYQIIFTICNKDIPQLDLLIRTYLKSPLQ
jgi:uncharacterized protein with HEPN domain